MKMKQKTVAVSEMAPSIIKIALFPKLAIIGGVATENMVTVIQSEKVLSPIAGSMVTSVAYDQAKTPLVF